MRVHGALPGAGAAGGRRGGRGCRPHFPFLVCTSAFKWQAAVILKYLFIYLYLTPSQRNILSLSCNGSFAVHQDPPKASSGLGSWWVSWWVSAEATTLAK